MILSFKSFVGVAYNLHSKKSSKDALLFQLFIECVPITFRYAKEFKFELFHMEKIYFSCIHKILEG